MRSEAHGCSGAALAVALVFVVASTLPLSGRGGREQAIGDLEAQLATVAMGGDVGYLPVAPRGAQFWVDLPVGVALAGHQPAGIG